MPNRLAEPKLMKMKHASLNNISNTTMMSTDVDHPDETLHSVYDTVFCMERTTKMRTSKYVQLTLARKGI